MGTKYSNNAESGYNATPPADDGTVSEANKVKWSTIKTKLGDPIKSLAETINSELVTHFDHGPTALTTSTSIGASHYEQFIQVSGSGVTLTLSDAATLGAGWNCEIHSTDSSNDVAIARATASDTINSLSNNFVLLPLQSVKVFVNAAANGFVLRDFGNIQSTDAGAGVGPSHTLYRNSASPAASDLIGAYNFDGEDSAGNRETYARIFAQIDDPGSTTEDGSLKLSVMKAGTLTLAATLSQTALNLASGWSLQENGVSVGGLHLISSQTASSSAQLDFTGIDSTYDEEWYIIHDLLPASDADLYMRVGTGGTPTYQSAAGDYKSVWKARDTAGAAGDSQTAAAQMNLNYPSWPVESSTGATGGGWSGIVRARKLSGSTNAKKFRFEGGYRGASGSNNEFVDIDGSLFYQGATTAVTALRFFFNGVNIASGTIYRYGVKKS